MSDHQWPPLCPPPLFPSSTRPSCLRQGKRPLSSCSALTDSPPALLYAQDSHLVLPFVSTVPLVLFDDVQVQLACQTTHQRYNKGLRSLSDREWHVIVGVFLCGISDGVNAVTAVSREGLSHRVIIVPIASIGLHLKTLLSLSAWP